MPNIEFDIDRVAELSMLKLSNEEQNQLKDQLPSIVAYVSKLHEVDTSEVKERAYLTEQENVFRGDDQTEDNEERKRVIEQFPKKTGDALEVPGVFE